MRQVQPRRALLAGPSQYELANQALEDDEMLLGDEAFLEDSGAPPGSLLFSPDRFACVGILTFCLNVSVEEWVDRSLRVDL